MGWAALTYALATLTLAYPALSGQFLVNPNSDQYIAGYAFRDFAAQALRSGHPIPHWNPYLFGGLPYVAAMHGDIFYPTALLRLLMPTDAAMTWGFAIHLFLAGLFTFGFLRAWGLSFFASLVGGLAYMLSGPIASYASPGHDGKLFVSALLPLALWVLLRGIRDGRSWAWGAFALTVGLAVLSPHPQLLQYLLLTSGAFALFLALGPDADGQRLDRRTGVRRLSFALAAVVVGMAIGAIQYAPVREYVAWSPRAGGTEYRFAASYSFPFIELVNIYLPQFTGILDKYWGPNGIHLHSEYLGGPMLLLASAAFGGNANTRFRRFWLGVGIVTFLWMLGGNTPFFALVYNIVPGTKFFRAPSTIIYVFTFCVSVFVALGVERVIAREVNRKLLFGWAIAGGVLALLASVGALMAAATPAIRVYAESIAARYGYPETALPQIVGQVTRLNGGPLITGAWRSFAFLFLAAGIVYAWQHGRIAARAAMIGLVLIVGADLWSIARLYWMFSPPAKVLFATDPAIEYLKHDPQPARVAVIGYAGDGLKAPDPYYGRDDMGRGTGLMIHGIRSITGYHGNELGRYDQLSQYRIIPQAAPAIMSPMFWRHENVRYLYTNKAVPDTTLKLVVGPVKNSAGSTVYLYAFPGDQPYAWLATSAVTAADSIALPAVIDPRFDPRRIAVFDTAAKGLPPAPTAMPNPTTISTSTSDYRPGHALITLAAPAPEGSTLVVSENFYPGWRAVVDGKARNAFRADFNLIGVPLPAGARTVELNFHDDAVDTGKIVTIIAVLLAIAALAAGLAVDRRRLLV